jgi:metal-responsive CopG/Arc/MetJ family transcriptional regulator
MRTIVDLPDDQLERLKELCEEEHISRAEAVRRAVDLLLASRKKEGSPIKRRAGLGILAPATFDSRKFVDELREEWAERDRRLGL